MDMTDLVEFHYTCLILGKRFLDFKIEYKSQPNQKQSEFQFFFLINKFNQFPTGQDV